MNRSGGAIFMGAGLFLLLGGGCREPTQIRLEIRTNVPCTSDSDVWRGVAVYTGKPGADEAGQAPVLVQRECDANGYVGSLVLVPSGDKDEAVNIRVVAGVTNDPELQPEGCAARDYEGCIVARRSVKYVPHESLDLQIDLTKVCISRPCDPDHTCSGGGCIGLDEPATAPPEPDAPSVRCGDNGVVCGTTGAVCCLTVDTEQQTTFGACLPPKDCPPTSIVLNCDDDTDCVDWTDDTGPGLCMLIGKMSPNDYYLLTSVAGSQCLGPMHQFSDVNDGIALCQERQPCNDRKVACQASEGDPVNPLPGYFWCRVARGQ